MISDNYIWILISFVVLNLIVLATATIASISLLGFKLENWTKLVLYVFSLSTLQVFLSQILLGIFGVLNYQSVWVINLIVFGVVAALLGRKVVKKTTFPPPPKLDTFTFLAIFTPFLGVFILRYFNALFQIPIEYDNVSYHLPFVVEWLKTGNLMDIYYSAFAGPLGYYPSNFELFDLWVFLPFGRDYFVNLLNFPIFPLLILAIYATCINFKIKPKIALLCAAIFIYMPQTFRQMGVPLVDLFFTLTFVTSIYFLQEFWKSSKLSDAALFGISTGLFVGTKYLGAPYVLPLFFALAIIALVKFWKDKKHLCKVFAYSGIGSIIGGGFWYIRNWIEVGNPIFPVEVEAFGIKIFGGYYGITERVLSYSLLANVNSWETFKEEFFDGFWLMTGGSTILFIGAFLATIAFLIFSLFKIFTTKSYKVHLFNTLFSVALIGLAVFYFYFYWKAPYTHVNLIPNVRYAMMFLIIGCFASGFIVSKIKPLRDVFYFSTFLVIAYNFIALVIYPDPEVILNDRLMLDYALVYEYWKYFAVYLLLLTALICFTYCIPLIANAKKKYIAAALLCVVTVSCISPIFIKKTLAYREDLRYRFEEAWYYDVPTSIKIIYDIVQASEWFNDNAIDANIAFTGFNFHYHLYGRELQREVDYININECLGCRYGDYKDSTESIRRDPDFDNWMSNLAAKEKNYIMITPYGTEGVYSWEFEWAQEHPENFEQVFEQNDVYIYKITY